MPDANAPTPIARNMYPSCDTVEYASTRLMSFCTNAIVPAISAVAAPTIATIVSVCGAWLNSTELRPIMYTPAVTIVAAWISADTGVGPSIASGSQTYSGICALLPVAPMNRQNAANQRSLPVAMPANGPLVSTASACADVTATLSCSKSSECARANSVN